MKIIRTLPAPPFSASATAPSDGSTDDLSATLPGSGASSARPSSLAAESPVAAGRSRRQTPGRPSQAARTIQRIWRGHASRRAYRHAALQDEMVRVCRRQAELWELGARLPSGVTLHPALVGEAGPNAKKRRRGTAAEVDSTPPCTMSAEQRLLRLKDLYAELWARAQNEVTPQHPTFLQRLAERQLTAEQRRRLLAQVRDDLFVGELPEDACWRAGFFSATHRPVIMRRRAFRAPAVDLRMEDA